MHESNGLKRYVQVWVALEENSEQVPSFTFIPKKASKHRWGAKRKRAPVSPSENRDSTRNSIRLPGIRLDTDPSRLGKAKEVIHDLKPLVTLRVVSTAYVDTALKLALRVVPQEDENGNDRARGNVEREFVLVN